MITYERQIEFIPSTDFYTVSTPIARKIFYEHSYRFTTSTGIEVRVKNSSDPEARLTKTDKLVLEALYSMHKAGNDYFTLATLKRFMSGVKNVKMTSGFKDFAMQAINKLKNTDITIEYPNGSKEYAGKLLVIAQEDFTAYGKKFHGWKFTRKECSPLMEQAQEEHMVVKHSASFLYKFQKDENTADTLEVMKDSMVLNTMTKFKGNTVTFRKLMEDVDYAIYSAEKEKSVLRLLCSILTKWAENGVIKGYRVNTKGGKRYSITFNK